MHVVRVLSLAARSTLVLVIIVILSCVLASVDPWLCFVFISHQRDDELALMPQINASHETQDWATPLLKQETSDSNFGEQVRPNPHPIPPNSLHNTPFSSLAHGCDGSHHTLLQSVASAVNDVLKGQHPGYIAQWARLAARDSASRDLESVWEAMGLATGPDGAHHTRTTAGGDSGGSVLDTWVGQHRIAWLDLGAGPFTWGPTVGGEGVKTQHTLHSALAAAAAAGGPTSTATANAATKHAFGSGRAVALARRAAAWQGVHGINMNMSVQVLLEEAEELARESELISVREGVVWFARAIVTWLFRWLDALSSMWLLCCAVVFLPVCVCVLMVSVGAPMRCRVCSVMRVSHLPPFRDAFVSKPLTRR